jgi:hypothetical protein
MDLSKLPKLSQTPAPPPDLATGVNEAPPPPPAIAAAMSSRPEWCRKCHAPNAPNSRFCASCGAGLGGPTGAAPVEVGAEAWISVAVGAILLLLQPRLLKFISHKLFGTFFAPYQMEDGTEVPYTAQLDFWSDLAITAFALVLIAEGIVVVFSRRPAVVLAAFLLTVAATLGNLLYLLLTFSTYGLALYSALAVAFGVYIALYQWRLYQSLRVPTL